MITTVAGKAFPEPATIEQLGELAGQLVTFLTTAQISEADMKKWLEDKDKVRDAFATMVAAMHS